MRYDLPPEPKHRSETTQADREAMSKQARARIAEGVELTPKAREALEALIEYGLSPLHRGLPEGMESVTPIPYEPELIVQTALSLLRKWLGAGGDFYPVLLWKGACLRMERQGVSDTYEVHPMAREDAPF